MTDATLQRIWMSRAAISKECGYNSRRLVEFYKQFRKKKTAEQTNPPCSRPASRVEKR
jgi:hypothetical protein